MAHHIQCIIGPKTSMAELTKWWAQTEKLDLPAQFSLIPLTTFLVEDINELANKGEAIAHEDFYQLSKSVEDVLKEYSFKGPIGYIETEYFGGTGTQVSIGYHKGKVLIGPLKTETIWDENQYEYRQVPEGKGAINLLLYALGLPERADMDGFDQLQLGHYRSNEKILKKMGGGK